VAVEEAAMSNLESARAQAEAAESMGRPSSADRARLWASLNRYLATEAEVVRRPVSPGPAHSEPVEEKRPPAAE